MRLCSRSKRATKDLAAPAVAGVGDTLLSRTYREPILSYMRNVLDHADLFGYEYIYMLLHKVLAVSRFSSGRLSMFSENRGAGRPRDV